MCKSLFSILLVALIAASSYGQFEIELQPFATGLSLPLDVVNNGTNRLYVIEKRGQIKMVDKTGQVLNDLFMDITDRVDATKSEKGLLGLAFHPDFMNNGEFYVNYTDRRGLTVISRFKILGGDLFTGDPDSEEIILQFTQPFDNHNGGDIAFGPDGFLYIASGDGGNANDPFDNSQTGTNLLGKILRIDVDTSASYKIPVSNPFVGNAGVNDEIWALGMRNPWRMSFDRMTGDLWIGDVGQGTWEEIDFQPASSAGGENYGWRCYEGNHEFNTTGCDPPENYTFPIYEYRNNRVNNGCSVTGGVVYRGSDYSDMSGWYIYCDYCSGKFWALNASDTTNFEIGDFKSNEFVGFGEDDDGELYVAAIQEGVIYRVAIPCNLTISVAKTDETCPGEKDGTADLMLSDTTISVNVMWSDGSTTEDISDLPPGKYIVEVTSSSCFLTDSVEILPSELDMSCLLDTMFTDTICQGDTIILRACDAPAGYEYEWSQLDAVIATTQIPELRVTESGIYSVAFKGDCPLGASQEVEINFTATPGLGVLTRSMDTLFTDATADTYRWYLNDVFLTETSDNYLVITESGDYRVQGVNKAKCEGPQSDVYTFIVTNSDDLNEKNISVSPNPSSGIFVLNTWNADWPEPEVVSSSGQVLNLGEWSMDDKIIDLRGHPKGVYFLKIMTMGSAEHQVLKLILE